METEGWGKGQGEEEVGRNAKIETSVMLYTLALVSSTQSVLPGIGSAKALTELSIPLTKTVSAVMRFMLEFILLNTHTLVPYHSPHPKLYYVCTSLT